MQKKAIIFLIMTAMILVFSQEDYICWEQTYSSEDLYRDEALSVTELSNGNYAVAGYYGIEIPGGQNTTYCQLNLLDPLGNLIWELPYIDEARGSSFKDVEESTDGNIITFKSTLLSATSGYQYGLELFKIGLEGNIIWRKLYKHKWSLMPEAFTKTSDGGFAICGYTELTDSTKAGIVMRLDENCDSLWTTEVEISGDYGSLKSIACTKNNELVAAGYQANDERSVDTWIVKLDSTGTILFDLESGDTTVADDYFAVCYDERSEVFVAAGGKIVKTKGHNDILITKFSPNCEIIWEKLYDIGNGSWDESYAVTTTPDGGFVVAGETNEDTFIMKVDSYGDSLWTRIYSSDMIGEYEQKSYPYDIDTTTDGGLIFCGSVLRTPDKSWYDWWVMKLDPDGLITGINDEDIAISDYKLRQNYPNPFNNQTQIEYSLKQAATVELNVYNVKSEIIQKLVSGNYDSGSYSVSFNADDLNSGIYYYQLKINGIVKDTKRMVYLK